MLSYNEEHRPKSNTFDRLNLPKERLVVATEIKVFYLGERKVSRKINSSIDAVCSFFGQLKPYYKKFTLLTQF